ncbi:cytochrome P450 [Streptomyces sp. NPDC051985]|uniref:cytochrome P450 n=1 Tax=Streptomyces sp. NPDC051985 TaxID=3155807 RepID=UPI00342A55A6
MRSTPTSPPSSAVDLFADDTLIDPYPAYRELREQGPAVFMTAYDTWVLPRYEHVRSALGDHRRFSSERAVAHDDSVNDLMEDSVLASDPPQHDRLRAVLAEKLAPRALADLRAGIAEQADRLVASVVERGTFDAVRDLAEVFPVTVVADLLGLPEDARDTLLPLADAGFNVLGPMNQRARDALPLNGELFRYVATALASGNVRPDGWAAAVHRAGERGDIEPAQVVRLLVAYVVAGMDTTINAIGNTVEVFARNPGLFQEVRAERALVARAFEECLRLESPAQGFFRVTTEDLDIDGVRLPARAKVLLSFGSANRDERKWERADEFDMHRTPLDHVGFGYGVHVCAGLGLARLEARAVLGALVRRVSSVEPAGEPVRRLNNVIRGLSSLPVTVREHSA